MFHVKRPGHRARSGATLRTAPGDPIHPAEGFGGPPPAAWPWPSPPKPP